MVPDSCQHVHRYTPSDLDVQLYMEVSTIGFEPEKIVFLKQNHDPKVC